MLHGKAYRSTFAGPVFNDVATSWFFEPEMTTKVTFVGVGVGVVVDVVGVVVVVDDDDVAISCLSVGSLKRGR